MPIRVLRVFCALLILLIASLTESEAATISVDASIGGTDVECPCGLTASPYFSGYETQLYTFSPGDTIDFGSVQLLSFSRGLGGGIYQVFTSSFTYSFGPISSLFSAAPQPVYGDDCVDFVPPYCGNLHFPSPTSEGLLFTIPPDANQLQIAWIGAAIYEPLNHTPLPSTFVLMTLGLAVIGLVKICHDLPNGKIGFANVLMRATVALCGGARALLGKLFALAPFHSSPPALVRWVYSAGAGSGRLTQQSDQDYGISG